MRVSDNGRFLVHEDGKPFFYLGDTAWELFHRLDRGQADYYLTDRAAKRFTVIQAVVLAEADGLTAPNRNGDPPLLGDDPEQPNEPYFQHVDWIVDRAAALGLHVGMLPTWGDKWNAKWGAGPEIFTTESAHAYGMFLGRRYAERPVIWILGGDRPVETGEHRSILRAMAEGLHQGDGGRHLISFHPSGWQDSSQFWPDEPWVDFHMCQSGHARNAENWRFIEANYARTPVKPCMDAEPGYEDHPAGFDLANGYLDEWDSRKSAYWSLFAGACGHTYGCHPVWQMWEPGRRPFTWARRPWYEALHLPGSGQMQHVRALLESRPYLARVPDQSMILSEAGDEVHHVRATRDADGSCAMVYLPTGRPVTVDLGRLGGSRLTAWWFNPRTGSSERIGEMPGGGQSEFVPPASGPDWVLVIDDGSRGCPPPGRTA